MANEISANNIKQSYDLAENKIFPKTTINGIVFDSDDSVVGSSAIVKSLVDEDLLVKNLEVNVDSSTGRYIHLKTNNGESGVSVLELKLGHRSKDDTSTNKIYINDADDSNTDVSAFFDNVEFVTKNVNATYGNLRVQCDKLVANYEDGSVLINKGGVSANEFSIIKDGKELGVLSSLGGSICLDGGDNGVKLIGFYGAAFGKKSNYGQVYADGSVLTLNCMKGYANGVIDVSVATRGKLCATYENGIDFSTKKSINLNSSNAIITGEVKSELDLVQQLETVHGGDLLKIYSDSTDSNKFEFGFGVNINSYQIDYNDIIKYTMKKSGIGNLNLAIRDYNTYGSICGLGYINISADAVTLDSGRVYGTVNGVHNVLMGVPNGSVVRWFGSSIPEGWVGYNDIFDKLMRVTYKGVAEVNGNDRLYRLYPIQNYSRFMYNGVGVYGYYIDRRKYKIIFPSCKYLFVPTGYIYDKSYTYYNVFEFDEYAKYKIVYEHILNDFGGSIIDIVFDMYDSSSYVFSVTNNNNAQCKNAYFKPADEDSSIYFLGEYDSEYRESELSLNSKIEKCENNPRDVLWNTEDRLSAGIGLGFSNRYGKILGEYDIFKYE